MPQSGASQPRPADKVMRAAKNPGPGGACRRRGRRLTRKSRRCVSNSNESAQRLLLRWPPSNLPNVQEEEMEEVIEEQQVEVSTGASNHEVCQTPFDDHQLVSSESAELSDFVSGTLHNSDDAACSHPSNSIVQDDKTRRILVIEGNKAIVVLAHPWPKRPPRMPLTEQYKKPNPRLTAAELRRQAKLHRERMEIVDELSREKRRRRFLKGVYCLPKNLIFDSRHRLFQWYCLPTDKLPEDCPAS